MGKLNSSGARTQGESNLGQKGLRDRSSPTCTLSQNGYGEALIPRFGSKKKRLGEGCGRGGGRTQILDSLRLLNSAPPLPLVMVKTRSRFFKP